MFLQWALRAPWARAPRGQLGPGPKGPLGPGPKGANWARKGPWARGPKGPTGPPSNSPARSAVPVHTGSGSQRFRFNRFRFIRFRFGSSAFFYDDCLSFPNIHFFVFRGFSDCNQGFPRRPPRLAPSVFYSLFDWRLGDW